MHLDPASTIEPWAGPPTEDEIVEQRDQADREAATLIGEPVAVARVDDRRVDDVGVRVYVPHLDQPRATTGAIVYLHGGGWVFGSITMLDGVCRRLADRSGLVVLSVDYRRAPEHAWPAALEDGDAVLEALAGRAEDVADLAVEPSRVVVGGDSAGGFLAAVLARRARDAGRPVAGQALVYPVVRRAALDDLSDALGDDAGLSAAQMRWFWSMFVGQEQPDPPVPADLDPLAADLAGLPPALVLTAEHDILRAEGEQYAESLRAAGVDVVASRFLGMPHGFFRKLAVYTAAGNAVDQVARWSAERVG